jgi:hypothetical protein
VKTKVSKSKDSSYLSVKRGLFGIIFCAYLFLHIILILLTSSGWSTFGALIASFWYTAFSIIAIVLIYAHTNGLTKKYFLLNKKLLACLIIFQFLMYVFNSGDCGDVACTTGTTFIEKSLVIRLFSQDVGMYLFTIITLIYLLLYIISLVKLVKNTK